VWLTELANAMESDNLSEVSEGNCMFFGRFLIALNCALYIGLALWTLFTPESVFDALQVGTDTRAAVIELQVLITGSFIGFVLLIGGGIFDKRKTKRALVGLFMINAAWFVTRCIALMTGLSKEHSTYLYMGFELAMLILLLIALRIVSGPRGRTLFRQEETSL